MLPPSQGYRLQLGQLVGDWISILTILKRHSSELAREMKKVSRKKKTVVLFVVACLSIRDAKAQNTHLN